MADDVTMAIADSKPPYIIADGAKGIEVDIARQALSLAGHTLVPAFFPPKRIVLEYNRGHVDAAMTVHEGFNMDGFLSDVTISYQNHAIFLKDMGLKIETLDDIAGYSILAFPNAKIYLGEQFSKIIAEATDYREIPNQKLQARILFAERADIAIADKRIFQYFAAQTRGERGETPDLVYVPVFPPSRYHNIFRNRKIRDDFNRGLQALHDSGDFDRILQRYRRPGTD